MGAQGHWKVCRWMVLPEKLGSRTIQIMKVVELSKSSLGHQMLEVLTGSKAAPVPMRDIK